MESSQELIDKESLVFDIVSSFGKLTESFMLLIKQIEKAKENLRSKIFKAQ
jgi:hypothetical protein